MEAPFPIILCTSDEVADFKYFEDLFQNDLGFKNLAICDINGNFTNDLVLPKIEDEFETLKILNSLKNYRVTKFDSAFPDQYEAELKVNHENFVQEVRYYFMKILDPYLQDIEQFFKPPRAYAGKEKTFNNYFDEDEYIANFRGT